MSYPGTPADWTISDPKTKSADTYLDPSNWVGNPDDWQAVQLGSTCVYVSAVHRDGFRRAFAAHTADTARRAAMDFIVTETEAP